MSDSQTIILIAFSIANSFRLFAYVPQITVLLRQRDTAAVSSTTWIMFFVSNATTAIYAAAVVADGTMAAVFLANTVCCGVIVLPVYWKRKRAIELHKVR